MKKLYSILFIVFSIPTIVAQDGSPGGPPIPTELPGPSQTPPHLPIDTNLFILVLAAVALGIYVVKSKKLKLQ